MNRKRKIFHDTVHGNISVPNEYCNKFIDTIYFQRLRRIEQTSMRSLYPSARHDRFIHSLGTFHLGSKIFQAVKYNSIEELKRINEKDWNIIQKTFEIACLLHDCGHAPFSHTFEKYFDKPANLLDRLVKEANDESFSLDVNLQADPAPHEMISACLVLTVFKDKIAELEANPILVVRMIIGCLFLEVKNEFEKFANCFISLLKGKIIDVDRLDYVIRDKWASGFSANNINVERLLSAACIKTQNDEYINCFYKNALSEIQSVIDVKNFQYLWIFSHHKVVYDQYILEKAIEKLSILMTNSEERELSLNKLFNIESFYRHSEVGKHLIYLPSDDDLVHLLKIYIMGNSYAEEWLSRDHKLKPVWKTFAEYNTLSRNLSTDELEEGGNLNKKSDTIVKKFLKEHSISENNYLKICVRPKIKSIGKNDIRIAINGKVIDYETFRIPNKIDNITKFFFYLYIPEQLIEYSSELKRKLFGPDD